MENRKKIPLWIKIPGGIFAFILFVELVIFLFPVKKELIQRGYPGSIRIYARDGRLLREAVNKRGARARWQELDKISPMVIDAFIAAEDERFYTHNGVDSIAVMRAAGQNFMRGMEVSGASTITMQLARLLYGHSHSIWGKLGQAFDARRLEGSLKKEEILTQYLNRVPFGSGAVGIEAASYRYFGKPGLHLSLAEAALLAGLPNAPSRYNPLKNPEAAHERQSYVLKRMEILKMITPEEYEQARKEPLVYYTEKNKLTAMHFTDYILSNNPNSGDIYTALDLDLTLEVEQALKDHIHSLSAGGMTNGAAVILDNKTGEILTMVGSVDYWDGEDGAFNGATALRQPGSALKPFTYALAFEFSQTPATVIPDIETSYVGHDGGVYRPVNYSEKYYGPVLLAEALGRSLNIPAIRLANIVGLDRLLDKLRDCGFSSLDKELEHYGLGLTLGNGEVSLLELVKAYSLFARKGKNFEGQKVFSPEAAFLVSNILSDEDLRSRAFGYANPLILGVPMAVKTGTSTNWRDNWIVGYNRNITLGIWTGDFKNAPMNQVSGAIGAGPLFNTIVRLLESRKEYPFLPVYERPPEKVEPIMVCKASGMTPSENCSSVATWYVFNENRSRPPCNVHRKVLIDTRNGLLASAFCPSKYKEERVYTYLPPEYSQWQAERGLEIPPTTYSPLCPPEGITAGALVVTNPRKDEIYVIEPGYDRETQTLELKGTSDPPVPAVEWIIDGLPVSMAQWPYSASWKLKTGKHTVCLQYKDRRSDVVEFEVR